MNQPATTPDDDQTPDIEEMTFTAAKEVIDGAFPADQRQQVMDEFSDAMAQLIDTANKLGSIPVRLAQDPNDEKVFRLRFSADEEDVVGCTVNRLADEMYQKLMLAYGQDPESPQVAAIINLQIAIYMRAFGFTRLLPWLQTNAPDADVTFEGEWKDQKGKVTFANRKQATYIKLQDEFREP